MPVKIANPRKQFQFQVSIPGLNPFLCQRVTTPSQEFDAVTHGDTGFEVKTAGMLKVGTLNISKLKDARASDSFFRNWARSIMDVRRGGGDPPSQYKQTIIIEEFSNDGQTVIDRKVLIGCWPQKLNGVEYNRLGSENVIEDIEFCVDYEEI